MNPLQHALIEKTGHDFGFEYVAEETANTITLASARHPVHAQITLSEADYHVKITQGPALLRKELARSFALSDGNILICHDNDYLADVLKRIASLGCSLPNQAETDFEATLKNELEQLPANLRGTEIERMVRQRVGQQTYRKAMMEYWGGACAVTGITTTEVLRASHAKPWADCKNDAERMDVFNGFLLNANLDALFDRFLISFTDEGQIIIDPSITQNDQQKLSLNSNMKLRWLAPEHLTYLKYHRKHLNNTT